MPTYSYRCTACENAFDIQQAFTDDTLTVCPSCGGALRKVFSPIGVSFSGSGFYRNDSRESAKQGSKANGDASAKADSGTKSDSGAKTESGSKSETKSESAPAPKAEKSAAPASTASSSSTSSNSPTKTS